MVKITSWDVRIYPSHSIVLGSLADCIYDKYVQNFLSCFRVGKAFFLYLQKESILIIIQA